MSDTTEARWRRAITTARAAGVNVQTNVNVCCHTCTTEEDLGMTEAQAKTMPYAYFLSTQGRRVAFVRGTDWERVGEDMRRPGDPTLKTRDVVYWAHGNGAGDALATAFRTEGFIVDYDGDETKTVAVHLRTNVEAV